VRATASDDVDSHGTSRLCQCTVPCNEFGVQRFRKGQIGGVIGRQTVTHLPNRCQQHEMRVAGNGKIGEIGESFRATFGGDGARARISAQDLGDFEVD